MRAFPLSIPFAFILQHSLAQCDSISLATVEVPDGAKLLHEYRVKKNECASYSFVFVKGNTYMLYIQQPQKRRHRLKVSFEHDKTGQKINHVKKSDFPAYEAMSFQCPQTAVYNFVIEYRSPDECTPMRLFFERPRD